MEVIIKYKVVENDSDWMSTRELENEEHKINIEKKEDIVSFLRSLEYVSLNEDVMKELEEDSDFDLSFDLDKLYTDRKDDQWISTDYKLTIKAV